MLIVVTDGLSADPDLTRQESKLTHAAGVTVFAVGVGPSYNLTELQTIASKADDRHVFTAIDFLKMEWIEDRLNSETCKGV